MEQRDQLTPAKNPFFQHADVTLFTAYQDGKLCGRISAQIDREHLARYDDRCGFYGFFDTINDPRVAQGAGRRGRLVAHVARHADHARSVLALGQRGDAAPWSRARPSPRCSDARTTAPTRTRSRWRLASPSARTCCRWKYVVGEIPRARQARPRRGQGHARGAHPLRAPAARARRTCASIIDVYNDAWSDNFHFVPMTEAELAKMVEDMKLILDEHIALIAEIDGKAGGHRARAAQPQRGHPDLHGRLFPLGLPKLLYRLKIKKPKSARLILLGIKQGVPHQEALRRPVHRALRRDRRARRAGRLRVGRAGLDP